MYLTLAIIFFILGLVGYYDSDASKSDDGSDSDGEPDTEQQRANDVDSESELMVCHTVYTNQKPKTKHNSCNSCELKSPLQKSIQRRKASFENKSIEIESYLAEIEEKEKQWLEQDDGVKAEDTDSPDVDSPVPQTGNQMRSMENDETQRDIHKVPTGENFQINYLLK